MPPAPEAVAAPPVTARRGHRRTRRSVFAASAFARLVVAIAYASAAAGLVIALRDGGDHVVSETAASMSAHPPVAIVIEATYPVARWLVDCDGSPVAGESDARTWRGHVAAGPGRTVSVTAEAVDADGDDLGALRVRLTTSAGEHRQDTVGHGSLSTRVDLAEPASSGAHP